MLAGFVEFNAQALGFMEENGRKCGPTMPNHSWKRKGEERSKGFLKNKILRLSFSSCGTWLYGTSNFPMSAPPMETING